MKQQAGIAANDFAGSPPARGRGLKHHPDAWGLLQDVAPRAGAWIETTVAEDFALVARRRPPRGGVD